VASTIVVEDGGLSVFEGRVSPGTLSGGSGPLRIWVLASILAVELVPMTMVRHPWLRVKVFSLPTIFFFVALLFFGRARLRSMRWDHQPINRRMLLLHGLALALFFAVDLSLLSLSAEGDGLSLPLLCLWYCALVFVPITIARALFRLGALLAVFVGLGRAWLVAGACGILMLSSRTLLLLAWDTPNSWLGQTMQVATFSGVRRFLSLFYPALFSDLPSRSIGNGSFIVQIYGPCSGIEGLALMLSLTAGWLFYARHELKLARAILLVPTSLALIFLLNIVRIALLVAIGAHGYEAIALSGFHSEAGWILFSTVALGFLILVNRVEWFRRVNSIAAVEAERNAAAIYLMPFLAIVAASLISVAASAGFEALYALRLPMFAVVAYAYRREYRALDWSVSWLGPLAGVGVFAIWIALASWFGSGSGGAIAVGLSHLTPGERMTWIATRVITAVVAVPFAEELAFRGFLARRIQSSDVENVSLRSLTAPAMVLSSLAFGAMHGKMWVAGTLAGMVFCLVARRRGRLGEAVAAHAVANLMIAGWVLMRGDYSLW
jgi:exosortase E/protease (VPEID-CTERM system)